MKKHSVVFFSVIFLFTGVLFAQQQGPDRDQPTPENGYGLQTMMLQPAQMRALGVHAEEKVQDFFDYLSLASDPELDMEMRKQSGELAEGMFVKSNTAGSVSGMFKELSQASTIQTLIQNAVQNKGLKWTFSLTEQGKNNGFSTANGQKPYAEFPLSGTVSGGKMKAQKAVAITLTAELAQVTKRFGNTKEVVWEVFFTKLIMESK